MNYVFCSACLALIVLVTSEYDPERFLKGFTLDLIKNEACLQIYNSTDQVDDSTCMKPQIEGKRSCALELQDDKDNCEIITPSNESIIVPCQGEYPTNSDDEYYGITFTENEEKTCYVVRKGQDIQEVCQELIANHTAVITTPDNYTLIVRSRDCYSGKWLSAILADKDFTSNFVFDPDERSCYKIFTPEQVISYQTCFEGIENPKACVHAWDKNPNCTVLTTPNNETVVVDCEGGTNTSENCVVVHKDDESTEVCMEELEEGCMGITTPSGLRLLFACRICRDQTMDQDIHNYDKVKLKSQRRFVKNLLEKGEYYKHKFEVWNDEYSDISNSRQSVYPYWLPNTTCYGLNLDTNETVILQCTDRKFEPKECFKIIDPDEGEENDICATVLEETCVIIDTPKGKRIFLGCYNELDLIHARYLNTTMAGYQNGHYPLLSDDSNIHRIGANCKKEKSDHSSGWLKRYDCWGVVTIDLERVILNCPSEEKGNTTPGCFRIYTQKYGPGNQILPSSYTEDEVCAEIKNDRCIGLTTPKGWNIFLDCYYIPILAGGVFKVKPKEPLDQF